MSFPKRTSRSSWKPTALVVDTDADIHRSIHVMLGKEYDVHHAYFPKLALSLLQKRRFNVVFTSLDMPDAADMPELHATIQRISSEKGIPVIGLAGASATVCGYTGCVEKPLHSDLLLSTLQDALAAEVSEPS